MGNSDKEERRPFSPWFRRAGRGKKKNNLRGEPVCPLALNHLELMGGGTEEGRQEGEGENDSARNI